MPNSGFIDMASNPPVMASNQPVMAWLDRAVPRRLPRRLPRQGMSRSSRAMTGVTGVPVLANAQPKESR